MNLVSNMIKKKPRRFPKHNTVLNSKSLFGFTAFHLACKNGHLNTVEMLIQKSNELNIDLNTKENKRRTAFHSACEYDR